MDSIEKIFRLLPGSPLREEALTHKSYTLTTGEGAASNSRLSALGKPLTRAFLVEYFLERKPKVSGQAIEQHVKPLMERDLVADFAKVGPQIHEQLRTGNDSAVAESVNVLANAFFALVGASYVEAGAEAAKLAVYAYADDVLEPVPGTKPITLAETAELLRDPTVEKFVRGCRSEGFEHGFEYRGTREGAGGVEHLVVLSFRGRELTASGPTRAIARTNAAEGGLILLNGAKGGGPRTARPLVQHQAQRVEVLRYRR